MEDKVLLEDILFTTKGACGLYMHGTIESETENIHSTFNKSLNDTLAMQNEIFTIMSEKGWYPSESAPQQKIQKAVQKYSKS